MGAQCGKSRDAARGTFRFFLVWNFGRFSMRFLKS